MRMLRQVWKKRWRRAAQPDTVDYDINYYLATAYYRNGQTDTVQ